MAGIILVAVDGSPFGSPALPYAEALARLTQKNLRLFAVVESGRQTFSLAANTYALQRERVEQERLEAYFADTVAAIRARGVNVSAKLVRGDPADAVLQEADRPSVDLVALSTQGRSGPERWVVGSVADKVMRLSPKPTLLVRRPYIPFPERPVTIQTILIPLDGSSLAEQALSLAEPLIRAAAVVHLVRVAPWLTEGSAPYGTVPEFVVLEEEAAREADAYLASVSRPLEERGRIERHVLRGHPAESLAGFALHEHIDLVVMTTHGYGGLRRLVVGSTADYLVRSGVPTLLLRPRSAGGEGKIERGKD